MAAPLLHEERALGVLSVLDRPEQSLFSLQEMELLGLFANQAAIAVDLLLRARSAELLLGTTRRSSRSSRGCGRSVTRSRTSRRKAGLRLLERPRGHPRRQRARAPSARDGCGSSCRAGHSAVKEKRPGRPYIPPGPRNRRSAPPSLERDASTRRRRRRVRLGVDATPATSPRRRWRLDSRRRPPERRLQVTTPSPSLRRPARRDVPSRRPSAYYRGPRPCCAVPSTPSSSCVSSSAMSSPPLRWTVVPVN